MSYLHRCPAGSVHEECELRQRLCDVMRGLNHVLIREVQLGVTLDQAILALR